jgi:hypothetical protein
MRSAGERRLLSEFVRATQEVPVLYLVGYSYPFLCSDDATWLANDLKPQVFETQGHIAVIGAEMLVVLPESVKPEHVERLRLFRYEEEPGTSNVRHPMTWAPAAEIDRQAGQETSAGLPFTRGDALAAAR